MLTKTLHALCVVISLTSVAWAARKPPYIAVTPTTGVAISGNAGGPFAPATFSYAIKGYNHSVSYRISGLPTWLRASSLSGTTPATITFTVDAGAVLPGNYSATISFANNFNHLGDTTRGVSLAVTGLPPPPPTEPNYLLCGPAYCTDDLGNRLTTGAIFTPTKQVFNVLFICTDYGTAVAGACK